MFAEIRSFRPSLLIFRELLVTSALGTVVVLAPPVWGTSAFAQQYWDTVAGGGVDGGDGTWDTGTANWTTDGGASNITYNNTPPTPEAVFGGSAGNVNLAGSVVNITDMTIETDGYNFFNGTLAIDSTGGTIDIGGGYTANISAALADLSGAASLELTGGGSLLLTGNNTFSGGTTVSAGTLTIAGAGVIGSVEVSNGASLAVDVGATAGALTNQGTSSNAGTVASLTNTNGTYNNSGAITGNVGLSAGTLTNSGSIGGTLAVSGGAFLNLAAGTTGTATLSGGYTTNSGAMGAVTNNGASGSNAGTMASLTNMSGLFSNSGTISGIVGVSGGSLTNSGIIDGAVTISGGTLTNNNAINNGVSISGTGILAGTGTVSGLTTMTGGTLAPGNSIGTIDVGDLTIGAGSTLAVEVDSAGQSDLVNASGTVSISSAAAVNVTPENGTDTGVTYNPSTIYTIITAAGPVSGTFGLVTDTFAFLDAALSYDANNVYLTLDRNDISFPAVAGTPNQSSTSAAVQALGGGNPVYDAVVGLSSPQAQLAFDMLSGEIHASQKTEIIEDLRFVQDAALNRSVHAGSDGERVWLQAYGALGLLAGNGNASSADFTSGGLVIGADTMLDHGWHLGVLGGLSQSVLNIPELNSSANLMGYHMGVYGGTQIGALSFDMGAIVSSEKINTNRNASFQGFDETLTADYWATTAQVFGEIGYAIALDELTVTPFAGLTHSAGQVAGFTETGGNSALNAAASMLHATFANLGMRAEVDVPVNEMNVNFYGSAGLRVALGDIIPTTDVALGAAPTFTIQGANVSRFAGAVELGLEADLAGGADLDLNYTGQIASLYASHKLSATLSNTF